MADAAHFLIAAETERLDGRTRYAKRLRALVMGLLEGLGGPPTVADQLLATQIATLTVRREAIERAMAAGETVDGVELTKLSAVIVRCLAALRGKAAARNGSGKRQSPFDVRDLIA
ncbi:hypothetical protein IVB57_18245 [Bradyrhizobium sp. CW9]|uniref:hypothetical protein n=1 Tax=Bradyrhizobium sp. CW9 TaxID=2782689 RepID=UPI001FF816FC|nr:hypothetical protein [Bradyrhizobium sp. CW9]MCK1330270.1 hypothetical protein [Bradyrhizobium sp. CW9]